MAGQQGILELREHGLVEADDTVDYRPASGYSSCSVAAQLLVHRNGFPSGGLEGSESCRKVTGLRTCGIGLGHGSEPIRPYPGFFWDRQGPLTRLVSETRGKMMRRQIDPERMLRGPADAGTAGLRELQSRPGTPGHGTRRGERSG